MALLAFAVVRDHLFSGHDWDGDWHSKDGAYGLHIAKQGDHYLALITSSTTSGDTARTAVALWPAGGNALASKVGAGTYESPSKFRFTMDDGDKSFFSHETSTGGESAVEWYQRGAATPTPPDTTPPTTAASNTNHWYNHAVSISLDATDESSGVAKSMYRVDGGAWTVGTTLRVADAGRHTVAYRSVDVAGNVEPTTKDWVGIDKTPPVTLALNAPSGVAGKAVTIDFKVEDRTPKATVRIVVAGPGPDSVFSGTVRTNVTWKGSVKLKKGEYIYRVQATDLAGNAARNVGAGQIHVGPSPTPTHAPPSIATSTSDPETLIKNSVRRLLDAPAKLVDVSYISRAAAPDGLAGVVISVTLPESVADDPYPQGAFDLAATQGLQGAYTSGVRLDYAQVEVDAGLTGDLYVDLGAKAAKRVNWKGYYPNIPSGLFTDYSYTGP